MTFSAQAPLHAGSDEPAARDGRSEPRSTLVFRAATIRCGEHAGFAVIKNVSATGAMIRTTVAMAAGATVVLELASGFAVAATVRWRRDDLAGVEFDSPQPVAAFLDGGDDMPRQQRRMPRLLIEAPVEVLFDRRSVRATTCDISTHGVRLACTASLPTGHVALVLPGLAAKSARILWCDGSQAGGVFNQPFRLDELTAWIASL